MTFKFYRYLVVNFPVWFLFIIPSVIFMYAASVDQINLEWELKFGECQLFNFTLEYTNKYMLLNDLEYACISKDIITIYDKNNNIKNILFNFSTTNI